MDKKKAEKLKKKAIDILYDGMLEIFEVGNGFSGKNTAEILLQIIKSKEKELKKIGIRGVDEKSFEQWIKYLNAPDFINNRN